MDKSDLAVLLALGAAIFIAIGDVIHQRSAQQVTAEPVGHVELFLRLLRDGRWWLGSLVSAVGFLLQAAALGVGSVLLVQALLVTSLLFALPINARVGRHRVSRWDWTWAVLLAASVVVIVTVGNPTAGQSRAAPGTWVWVVAVLAPVLLACIVGANRTAGRRAAVLLALASGTMWGVFAVLTKGVVHLLSEGAEPLLRSPEVYIWAAVAVGGTMWQQASFRAGVLAASLPTMVITEPLVASVLSVVVLGETLRPGDAGWLLLVVAIGVMVVAAVALARGEARTVAEVPAR